MFPKLQEDKVYKKDLALFEKVAKNCHKEYTEQMTQLITRFKSAAEQIDLGHDSYSGGLINPRSLIEVKKEFNESRLQLFSLLKKLNLNS
jgi:hypothetical protein